jgi:hypothetical protein
MHDAAENVHTMVAYAACMYTLHDACSVYISRCTAMSTHAYVHQTCAIVHSMMLHAVCMYASYNVLTVTFSESVYLLYIYTQLIHASHIHQYTALLNI